MSRISTKVGEDTKECLISGIDLFLDNNSMIVRGATDLVYKKIEEQLSGYMGRVFDNICTQYLWKRLLVENSPIEFVLLDRWWRNF